MSVRLRRLAADHENIVRAFSEHPHVRVLEKEGDPPERYKVEFTLKGLVVQDGRVVPKPTHVAEVYLPLGYPRQAPQCRMLSPIYHPNIAPHAICIGDHWSAGESLAGLIARIGELITFQSYNVKSPLNGEAARWAEQNVARLPLQKVDLSVGVAAAAAPPPVPAPRPPPAVRYPSSLVRPREGGAFPYEEWGAAVQEELSKDPAVAAFAEPCAAILSSLREGRPEEAVQRFEPIKQMPAAGRLPQVHLLVALIREAHRDSERRLKSLENAVRVDPTCALAWSFVAEAAAKAGEKDRAIGAAERCLAFDPGNAATRGLLDALRAPA